MQYIMIKPIVKVVKYLMSCLKKLCCFRKHRRDTIILPIEELIDDSIFNPIFDSIQDSIQDSINDNNNDLYSIAGGCVLDEACRHDDNFNIYSGTTMYLIQYDQSLVQNPPLSDDRNAFAIRINSQLSKIKIDMINDPVNPLVQSGQRIVTLDITNRMTFIIRGNTIMTVINDHDQSMDMDYELKIYVNGKFYFGHSGTKPIKDSNQGKYKEKKKSLSSHTLWFKFNGKTSSFLISEENCEKSMDHMRLYEIDSVQYYSSIMNQVLFFELYPLTEEMNTSSTLKDKDVKKRGELYAFLEENKDSTDYIVLDAYATSFVHFIDILQGEEFDIDDDILYLEILIYAYRYGCLDLLCIDRNKINRILDSATQYIYDGIKEIYFNIRVAETDPIEREIKIENLINQFNNDNIECELNSIFDLKRF
jgi:hypothetical protein